MASCSSVRLDITADSGLQAERWTRRRILTKRRWSTASRTVAVAKDPYSSLRAATVRDLAINVTLTDVRVPAQKETHISKAR